MLYALAWSWILIVTTVTAALGILLPHNLPRGLFIILCCNTNAFISLVLNKKGYVKLASVIFSFSFWALATGLSFTAGGVTSPATVTYLPIILTAGFLLGGIWGIAMAILCIIAILIMVLFQINGLLPPSPVAHTPLSLWLSFSVSALLVAGMQYMATRRMRLSLDALNREISERKDVEAKLRASEFNNQLVVRNKILGIAWAMPDGIVFDANQTFCDMLGYSLAELKGAYFGNISHPDDVAIELIELEKIVKGKTDNYVIEKRYKHKHGYYFWVNLSLTCFRNPETNDISHFVGIVQNIQERKLIEVALRDSEERYRALVENAPEALVVFDFEKNGFASVSESAVQFFKAPKEELMKRGPVQLSPQYQPNGKLSSEIAREKINEAINGGKPVFEWTHCDIYGTPIACEVRLVRLPSVDGILIRGSIIDISERKEVELKMQNLNELLERKVKERTAELELLNADLKRFNSMLSHDLRGSIRRIKSFSSILSGKLGGAKAQADDEENLEIIKKEATKMDIMVTGLLEFSKLGNKPVQLKPVDVDEIVNGLVNDLKKQWPHKKIEFTLPSLPVINSDQVLIQQVFANLLSNAFKYSSRNEVVQITVTFTEDPLHYKFSIADNGVGFDMSNYDKLFGEFVRLHAESEFEGTGIGLNSVKRYIEKLGGRIWAESIPGEGSTFSFLVLKQPLPVEN